MKKIRGKIKSTFSWNGFYYASVEPYGKSHRTVFYKSHNCRFDETLGGTEECSSEEFFECAEKYAKAFGDERNL